MSSRPASVLGCLGVLMLAVGCGRTSQDVQTHDSAVGDNTGGTVGSATGGASPMGGERGGIGATGGATAGSDAPGGNDSTAGEAHSSNGGNASAGAPSEVISTVVDLPAKPRGYLFGVQVEFSTDTVHFAYATAHAEFQIERGRWDGCTRNQLGDCWYYDCPPDSYPFRMPDLPFQSASTVSVASLLGNSGQLALTEKLDHSYDVYSSTPLWPLEGGATLSFSALGDVAPAFSLAVQSPPMVWLASVNGQTSPTSIKRSDGLQLAWTSSGPGTASFSIVGSKGARFAASCEFDALANAGELPASLFNELEPGPNYYIDFWGLSLAHRSVDGWDLEAAALSESTGSLSDLKLTLE